MLVGNVRTIIDPQGGFWGAANNQSTLFYTKQEFNRLVDTGLLDFTSPYQSLFKIFDVLVLQRDFKYKTRWFDIRASWQPFKACTFDPNGKIVENESEVVPCKGMLNMEQCPTDWINSCYAALVQWKSGNLTETALDEVMAKIMNLVGRAAFMGAMDILTCGRLYTLFTNYAVNPALSASEKAEWDKQLGLCNGWLYTLAKAGLEKGAGNLLANDILTDAYDKSNGSLIVDFEGLFDKLVDVSTPRLKNAVFHGSLVTSATNHITYVAVDNYTFQGVVRQYNAQCKNVNCTTMRMTKEIMTTQGLKVDVYKIDNTIIVPILNTADWDERTKGITHFMVLGVSQNIQVAASLDNIMDAALNPEAALTIYRDPDPSNPKVKITAYALFGTGVADTDLVSSAIVHITKA